MRASALQQAIKSSFTASEVAACCSADGQVPGGLRAEDILVLETKIDHTAGERPRVVM